MHACAALGVSVCLSSPPSSSEIRRLDPARAPCVSLAGFACCCLHDRGSLCADRPTDLNRQLFLCGVVLRGSLLRLRPPLPLQPCRPRQTRTLPQPQPQPAPLNPPRQHQSRKSPPVWKHFPSKKKKQQQPLKAVEEPLRLPRLQKRKRKLHQRRHQPHHRPATTMSQQMRTVHPRRPRMIDSLKKSKTTLTHAGMRMLFSSATLTLASLLFRATCSL